MGIILEGAISVLAVLESDPSRIGAVLIRRGLTSPAAEKVRRFAEIRGVTVRFADDGEIGELTAGRSHGGIIAAAEKRGYNTAEEIVSQARDAVALIEGIEDPYNLGYAARAAYTQGIGALLLPRRDFGDSEAAVERASTGTFSRIPAALFSSGPGEKAALISTFKAGGYSVYCIDNKKGAKSIFEVRFKDKALIIVGGEKRGISREFAAAADESAAIPYARPFPHSLAAQTALSIAAFELHRQRREGRP